MSNVEKLVQDFRNEVARILHFEEAMYLMEWDLRTGAPKRGVPLRAEAIGTLSDEVFRAKTSPRMESYLNRLSDPDVFATLDSVTAGTVRELKRQFDRDKAIPADRKKAFVMLTSEAQSVWEEAKETSDFELFRPYLERIVDMQLEFIDYWGFENDPYDTLLHHFEPGLTVAELDPIFRNLRQETVRLLQDIVASGVRPEVGPLLQDFPIWQQRELSTELLLYMGFDFSAGRLDTTVHPFMSSINRYDARVTTMYVKNDLRSSVFSTIHEGGHALYEQGIADELIGTPLCTGTSMGMHESQSRFYENMIGRSMEFWETKYPSLLERFPTLSGMSLEAFYAAINEVQPSLVRIDADEVTYNLHIMIRYEIEKALINRSVKVAELPLVWGEKMQDYLGVVPPNDALGVLQDVHWSGGDFGYFPSYTLGNIYAAQIREALHRDIPDYMSEVLQGHLLGIKNWLNDKVHRFGKLLGPREILQQVTGQGIDSGALVRYLNDKYRPLYHI
ncbi:carboxypeptidase M32 [Alicyclobacillus mengziensis]|uniref:carboxypeptidase M32 n=1 Tax=Alicyclobacillus mengziensis TaxID=2931921 RepID=UPI0020138CFA|nr:carboxypeptidase M32 [Alicyclobacillus mengziensis]